MKTYVAAKIHGVRVTDKSVDYNGSVSVDSELLKAAGIEAYEQVDVINLSNGARWTTYALPLYRQPNQQAGFTLNGGGARLGEVGDACIVIAYRQAETMQGAPVVFCDERNHPYDTRLYSAADYT